MSRESTLAWWARATPEQRAAQTRAAHAATRDRQLRRGIASRLEHIAAHAHLLTDEQRRQLRELAGAGGP
jgi:hypothetical protein